MRINRPLALTLLLCLLSAPALAKDTGTDNSKTILKHLTHFVVQQDGSFVDTTEIVERVEHERAIPGAAQSQFSFNATLESIDVLEAYTEKPNGRRLVLGPDQIKVQQEAAYGGAPMFQDLQVKTLIFSDVQVGDVVHTKIRKTRRAATFAGHFSDDTTPYFHPTKQLTVMYDLPATMLLHVSTKGFAATPAHTDKGRTVYRWDYIQSDNARREDDAVDYADYGQRLTVSTFPDFASVGLAYDKLAGSAAVVTPAIMQTVNAVIRDAATPRDKVLAIHDWIRRNVRYVAVYIGNGGVVPHSADEVMRSAYGDCKDHATLMEAMLKAAGIDSTPALINYGNAYALPAVASLGQFNHAITYVPSLDLYIDSTAADVEGGYLPFSELDKPVIHAHTGKLGHTPVSQAATIRIRYQVDIAPDGAADVTFTRNNAGLLAEVIRYEHRNWKKPDQDRFVGLVLNEYKMRGNGTVELGDVLAHDASYAYTLKGHADNWLYLPGTVGMTAYSSLWSGMAQPVFAMASESERTQPYVCPVNDFIEEAVYQFPPGSTVLHLPKDVTINTNLLRFQARYVQQGRQLHITRVLDSGKHSGKVCSPADYAAMLVDIKKMVQDLRSQVILQVQ